MYRKCLFYIGGGLALLLAILYMAGVFDSGRIEPGRIDAAGIDFSPAAEVRAGLVDLTEWSGAVGTVRPTVETRVEAQVSGRVLEVKVRPGDRIEKGQELVVLDDREFKARLAQAEQGLSSALAARDQAGQGIDSAKALYDKTSSTLARLKELYRKKVLTSEELERGETSFLQAGAGLRQARDGLAGAEAQALRAGEMVKEARIALGYTRIEAQSGGEVSRRSVEPGDSAFPGKELLIIQTGGSLRLEALVREGLISKVRIGDKLPVEVTALGRNVDAVVDEIAPSADPMTRSFVVKASLPSLPGLYPGMFGRLLIPLEKRRAVVIPKEALRRVGQLETVLVKSDGGWRNIYVTSGAERQGGIEILSGLSGNETLGVGGAK